MGLRDGGGSDPESPVLGGGSGRRGGIPDPTTAKTASAAGPPPDLQNKHDVLAWKREYNIQQREADWKRRQDELLTQKQVAWQIEKLERENRIANAKQNRRKGELESRICQRHLEVDDKYKDRCRVVETERHEQAWEKAKNARLVEMCKQAQDEAATRKEWLSNEKARLWDEMQQAAVDRAQQRRRAEELNRKREENIRRKEEERERQATGHAHQLKKDARAIANAVVSVFTDRVVPQTSDSVSIWSSRRVDPQYSHFGAPPTGII